MSTHRTPQITAATATELIDALLAPCSSCKYRGGCAIVTGDEDDPKPYAAVRCKNCLAEWPLYDMFDARAKELSAQRAERLATEA